MSGNGRHGVMVKQRDGKYYVVYPTWMFGAPHYGEYVSIVVCESFIKTVFQVHILL